MTRTEPNLTKSKLSELILECLEKEATINLWCTIKKGAAKSVFNKSVERFNFCEDS